MAEPFMLYQLLVVGLYVGHFVPQQRLKFSRVNSQRLFIIHLGPLAHTELTSIASPSLLGPTRKYFPQ